MSFTTFNSNEDSKYLMGIDGTLDIDGINCAAFSFKIEASVNSITAYSAVIKARDKYENIELYAYLKKNLQRLISQMVGGSNQNPFTITSGDYIFRAKSVGISCGEGFFVIELDGSFFKSDTMRE